MDRENYERLKYERCKDDFYRLGAKSGRNGRHDRSGFERTFERAPRKKLRLRRM